MERDSAARNVFGLLKESHPAFTREVSTYGNFPSIWSGMVTPEIGQLPVHNGQLAEININARIRCVLNEAGKALVGENPLALPAFLFALTRLAR